jgi:hypothetical protein
MQQAWSAAGKRITEQILLVCNARIAECGYISGLINTQVFTRLWGIGPPRPNIDETTADYVQEQAAWRLLREMRRWLVLDHPPDVLQPGEFRSTAHIIDAGAP